MPTEDDGLTQVSFRDQNYLISFGLSPDNALEYFCESPFYFKFGGATSLNEKVRLGQLSSVAAGIEEANDKAEWFECVYVNNEGQQGFVDEGVFVIQRFTRFGTLRSPKELFYILAGTIHQSTTLGMIIEKACATTASNFKAIFDAVETVQKMSKDKDVKMTSTSNGWPDFVKFPDDVLVEETQIAFALRAELGK